MDDQNLKNLPAKIRVSWNLKVKFYNLDKEKMLTIKIEDGHEAPSKLLSLYLRTPSFPTSLQLNI